MIRKLFNYVLLTSVLASISGTPVLAECGKASWYELTGRTASGVMADPEAYTAAHRSLPFGTKVTVTNLANGRKVDLIIVDRGPFVRGRVIDVSRRAARDLRFIKRGIARVHVATDGNTTAASCG
ncbi:MAG: septal ring lytic transglycosylase RlpA family lipoprotein [Rhodobacteraceae bacterium]|mgnify:CR=1 FL=1|nr:septal ring lytic transglycosylase RlpA family lipoprotein [Paracoccaceae bacterium]